MVCYDGRFPASYRTLVDQGVDIVCVPTNWVPIPGQVPGQPGMATILSVGVERGQGFIGQSLFVDHTCWPVASPASRSEPQILVADVDVAAARKSRSWGAFNNPVKDLRPDAYQ